MPVLLEVDAGKSEYHKSNGAVQVLGSRVENLDAT